MIHPMGVLTFSERLVPLELDIAKFGNKLPKDAKRFEIKATDADVRTGEGDRRIRAGESLRQE